MTSQLIVGGREHRVIKDQDAALGEAFEHVTAERRDRASRAALVEQLAELCGKRPASPITSRRSWPAGGAA